MAEKPTIGLAISGGGYRATLYSLGALWRINEFGLLPKFKTITSVSGGSITTGYLAVNWNKLIFDGSGIATNFEAVIAKPLQKFCSESLDVKAVLSGLLSFKDTIGDKVAKAYDSKLFLGATIQSLSDNSPDFLFYGTNYQTGSSLRIEKSAISDYKIGKYPNPDISMAKAVGVSSAFPPVLSPVTLDTDPNKWERTQYSQHFDDVDLRKRLMLTDGGLYDNMGLEAIWKGNYSHVLVCDAGAPFDISSKIKTNWLSQLIRMTDLMTDQQRALRKRTLIANYEKLDQNGNHAIYGGTYFGITTEIRNYDLADSIAVDNALTKSLQHVRTRLNAFNEKEQGHLINWGYALADTAIRKHAIELLGAGTYSEASWPISDFPL